MTAVRTTTRLAASAEVYVCRELGLLGKADVPCGAVQEALQRAVAENPSLAQQVPRAGVRGCQGGGRDGEGAGATPRSQPSGVDSVSCAA